LESIELNPAELWSSTGHKEAIMTRKLFSLTTLLLAISLIISGCNQGSQSESIIAVVKNLSGSVAYFPASTKNSISLKPADIKRSLFAMDKIVVGKDSFLQLNIPSQGDVFVEPETTIILQQPEQGKKFQVFTKVAEGVVDCFIEKKNSNFAVQTPLAVAGVLGTSFQVKADSDTTTITLVESEKGVEVQNLAQNLTSPAILKNVKSNSGIMMAQSLTLKEEATEADKKAIQNIEQLNTLTFPSIKSNGKIERVPFINYHTRVNTYER
jgi:hypothetical protein